MKFFCAAGHPLARKKRVALDDLFEFPWAGPSVPGRAFAALPQGDKPAVAFDNGQFHPRILVGTSSAVKEIVHAGRALAPPSKARSTKKFAMAFS